MTTNPLFVKLHDCLLEMEGRGESMIRIGGPIRGRSGWERSQQGRGRQKPGGREEGREGERDKRIGHIAASIAEIDFWLMSVFRSTLEVGRCV